MRHQVGITLECPYDSHYPGYKLYVYIEANTVKKISHERIEADSVIIDLPGDIISINEIKRQGNPRNPANPESTEG